MLANTILTPLDAERYLGGNNNHHQLPEGQCDRFNRENRLPREDDYCSRSPSKASNPATASVTQPEQNWQRGHDIHGISPTSTETSSDDLNFEALEEGFNDNIFVRKLSWSGSSEQPALTQSCSTSSCMDSIPENQLLPLELYSEIYKKDKQLKKLMKQLNKIQRRIVHLEAGRRCRDLRLAKYTEREVHFRLPENNEPVVGDLLTGASGRDDNSNPSDEESQQGFVVGSKTQPNISPDTSRLVTNLLNEYTHMESMDKEEEFQNDRKKILRGARVSSESKDFSARSDIPSVSSNRGHGGSIVPDLPEVDTTMSERDYVHSSFHAVDQVADQNSEGGSNDGAGGDDDLSSRAVDTLIDEDVRSDCQAVRDHNGDGRQYWRDIILGVNDGLVSTFLLVAGVRGGGMDSTDILLTAIAGAVAGAVSMCAGEYVATKSQNEVMQGEVATEERHIREHRRDELVEVSHLLTLIGIDNGNRALQRSLIRHYAKDSEALLKIMIALELGCLADERRSPFMAGFVSFFLFIIGATPSVIPFMIPDIDPTVGFIVAGVATCVVLLIVGAVKTWATKGNWLTAAMENLCIAGFGGSIAYGVGVLAQNFIE